MRIAYVVTSLERAGAQAMLLKVITALPRERFAVCVVSLAAPAALSGEFSEVGVPVYHLGVPPGRISIRALFRLVRILRSERPDVIQGWMYHGNLAAQLAARFVPRHRAVLWSIRGTSTDLAREKRLTALTIWMTARLSGKPAAIVNCSRSSAEEHERRLKFKPGRQVVIPNGFDTSAFRPSAEARACVRAELGVPEDGELVGLVARFHPMKDHATFLRALALARREHPALHGVLLGLGADKANAKLRSLIAETGTGEFIHCLGERSDISRITGALDIACNTSVSEGFPNAVGEAMSCAIACVVTDVGDSGWLVGDTGRVVPSENPELFAAALGELLRMGRVGRKLLGERARQRIIENFSIEAVASRYDALYEKFSTIGID